MTSDNKMGGKYCFLLLFAFLNIQIASSAVRVNIFYETYNEHVRKFITEQVGPLADRLDDFGDKLDLKFYPYGNTTKIGNNYDCPTGPTQCIVNSIHACAMHVSGDLTTDTYPIQDVLPFVRCFFKNRFATDEYDDLTEYCLDNNPIDFVSVEECFLSTKTVKTLTDYLAGKTDPVKDQVKKAGLAIQIDGNVDVDAEKDLLGKVCGKIGDPALEACKNIDKLEKLTLTVFYEANNPATGKYFSKQLFPFYHVLEDFVDLELVPYGDMEYDVEKNVCGENNVQKCQSNIFQSLVINKYMGRELNGDIISGANRAVDFIDCLFHQDTTANVFRALEKCSDDNLEKDEYEDIIGLMKITAGDVKTVMTAMKEKTDKVKNDKGKMVRLPYVQLNGVESVNAFNDLIEEACDKYKGPKKPSLCFKVEVAVLYEVLDHKTRKIFLEELKPIFNNLQSFIDFRFIPAGSIQLDSEQKNICSSDRCNAVKYQTCIVDYFYNDGNNYTDPIRQEVFESILCIFKNKDMLGIPEVVDACSELIEADVGFMIRECFAEESDASLGQNIKDTEGLIVQAGGTVTREIFPAFVMNAKILTTAELKKTICDKFDEYHAPNYCLDDPPKKVKIRVFYQSDSELSKYFFTTQYDPWYLYLEEMLDVDLIPGGDDPNFDEPITGLCDDNTTTSVCFANKIQAFVIDTYSKNPNPTDWLDGTMRTMHFMRCVFSHPKWKIDFHEASLDCAESQLLPDESFELLVSALADKTIYKEDLELTKQYLDSIEQETFGLLPWITIETDTGAELHRKRLANDLLQSVCGFYQGEKPPECTPVNIEVYYSSFHPQSRRFFVDELVPLFRNIRERVHLDLIPFGTLKNEDKNCNSVACRMNKYHACAIQQYFVDDVQESTIQWDGKNQTLSYIHCMFKNIHNYDISTLSEECANKLFINSLTIKTCAMGEEGNKALQRMREKTANLFDEMKYAPWVVINGKPVAAAQGDLRKEVCAQIAGDWPEYCLGPRAEKVKLQFHYSSMDENSQNYVRTELYPNYRSLEEIMELDLVCLGECEPLDIPDNPIVQCPNHVQEARTNLIHACIHEMFWKNDEPSEEDRISDSEYDGKLQVVEFLKCYFDRDISQKPVDAAQSCAEETFNDAWRFIEECAHNGTGFKILKRYQLEKVDKLLPNMKYVPWMTVNNVHNYAVESHIKRTVCDAYKGAEKPLDCYDKVDKPDKPYVEIHYELDDTKSVPFFTKYLVPEKINELSRNRFIPFGRSTKDKDGNFVCVNDKECHRYREHLCLIKHFYDSSPEKTMKAIACTFTPEMIGKQDNVNQCVNRELGDDDYETVAGCAKNDEEAKKLLLEAFDSVTALSKKLSHSPWIVINQEHNIEAEVDLPDELCSVYYPTDKPEECQIQLLDVGIYYQAQESGSQKFVSEQLAAQVQYLGEIGVFDFVPFGKTNINADGSCPKDDKQCHATAIHACAVNHVNKYPEDRTLNEIRLGEFFVCVFTPVTPAYGRYLRSRELALENRCANDAFSEDIWFEFHECATGPIGKELMLKLKDKTNQASIGSKLPEVIIDGKKPRHSRDAFFQVLCNAYGLIRPPLCRTIGDFGVDTGIYFSGNKASQKYFNEQIKPLYDSIAPTFDDKRTFADDVDEQLYRLISPTLVPWGETKYDATAEPSKRFQCKEENECLINRFFACAIAEYRKEPRAKLHLMEFAVCFFSYPTALTDPMNAAYDCSSKVWILDSFVGLESCAKSEDEFDQNKALIMKDLTEQVYPPLKSYPSITIDNNFNQNATDGPLFDVLCKNYMGLDIPATCPNAPGPEEPEEPVTPTPDPNSAISTASSSFILLIVTLFIMTLY